MINIIKNKDMKIANSKKLAGCLVNEAICRKKLGKEIADSLFKLMNQLRKIVDVRCEKIGTVVS